MNICQRCHARNPDFALRCAKCHAELTPPVVPHQYRDEVNYLLDDADLERISTIEFSLKSSEKNLEELVGYLEKQFLNNLYLSISVEKIIDALERSRMALLKDLTVLDKMYELNMDYLKQLDVYIAAGEQALHILRSEKIPALETEVAAGGDVMSAQRLADLEQAATRFERRLHDLKLTRVIAIQTAPQIRLIQSNDQNLVEKIQSSILTTIPLWKNQIVIAISLYRQQKAAELQKQVADTTNELLAKNAELLREGSAKVGREVERGVVDVETLQKVNADLIATLEETIRIQEEGRTRRVQAEEEIGRLQVELKQKLLELRAQTPQIDGAGEPRRLTGY